MTIGFLDENYKPSQFSEMVIRAYQETSTHDCVRLVCSISRNPGVYAVIEAIEVCAAPKGVAFESFWSEIGYRF